VSEITRDAAVCALVPHFACEAWLGAALESLDRQSRRLDHVVVIDDASPDPRALIEVCAAYPQVTVLATDVNVGPYALVQAVIDAGAFDAYLFQDADDWSAPDRLEMLLAVAESTGAGLVGCGEMRVLTDAGELMAVAYPADVNAACAADPGAFALLHPTSLVASSLLERLGGFSTGLRFSGDAELLARAVHATRVVNAPAFAYWRRKRAGSLTTEAATGLMSPARLALHDELRATARARHAAAAAERDVDLSPLSVRDEPVVLTHLAGPAVPGLVTRAVAEVSS
jgi:glycosyltransferase involved in cell wall biosynthesis